VGGQEIGILGHPPGHAVGRLVALGERERHPGAMGRQSVDTRAPDPAEAARDKSDFSDEAGAAVEDGWEGDCHAGEELYAAGMARCHL
jgi:hypothetical protein